MHIPLFPVFIVIAGLVVIAVAAAVKLLARSGGVGPGAQPVAASYEPAAAFLTPAERSFFGVLQQAVAADYQIFAKVRLADIIRPARNPSRSGWQAAFNRIAGKHVDFVLCDKSNLHVICAIELDDKTHERFDRGVRDSLVDTALGSVGIPILRVAARQGYSPAEIRSQVQNLARPAPST